MNRNFTLKHLFALITLARILIAAMTWRTITVGDRKIRPLQIEMEDGGGLGWNIYGYDQDHNYISVYLRCRTRMPKLTLNKSRIVWLPVLVMFACPLSYVLPQALGLM